MSCPWDTTDPRFYWREPVAKVWECDAKRKQRRRKTPEPRKGRSSRRVAD